MTTRIYSTGIRSGEYIIGAPGQKQVSGTVIQIRGSYPPSKLGVSELDDVVIRDIFNLLPFFSNKTYEQRRVWLESNAIENKDLYMEDVPGLELRFVKISGQFFLKSLSQEQLDLLLRGNPSDPQGYWPIRTVYDMFPKKPGSKARKHTLIFRPNNWSLQPEETRSNIFTGLYFDMDELVLKNGTINSPGYLRVFKTQRLQSLTPEYAAYSRTVRTNDLTWDHILSLLGEYGPYMNQFRPIIDWFPPPLLKSLIQKLIRTRCLYVEHNGITYNPSACLLTAISLLALHPGSFVPNIQRFVSGLESASKRIAVSICEDGYLENTGCLALLYISASIAQQDKEWRPTDTMLMFWFQSALISQRDPRIFDYDWKTFSGIKQWNNLSFSYLVLAEVRSFDSDINMVGSIAEREGKARTPLFETRLMETMPLIHCVDQHTYTEIAHYMHYSGLPYNEIFGRIWDRVVGVNPRVAKYQDWTIGPDVIEIREAQRLVWLEKTTIQRLRVESDRVVKFTYRLDPSWIAGLIGPMETRVGAHTIIVVCRTDDVYQYTAVKKPSRDEKTVTELSDEDKSQAIESVKRKLEAGWRLNHVPSTLAHFTNAVIYLRGSYESVDMEPEYYIQLSNGVVMGWREAINLSYEFHTHSYSAPSVEDGIIYTGNGIMEEADTEFAKIISRTNPNILRRLATYLEGFRTNIELHRIARDGSGIEYAVLPEDTGVHEIMSYICCLYPAALMHNDRKFIVKNGPLLWSLRDKLKHDGVGTSWAIPGPDGRSMWEHQKDVLSTMIRRAALGKRGHLLWLPVGTGKSLITTNYIRKLIEMGKMPAYCVWTLPPSAVDSIRRELEMAHLGYQIIDMTQKGGNKVLKAGDCEYYFS